MNIFHGQFLFRSGDHRDDLRDLPLGAHRHLHRRRAPHRALAAPALPEGLVQAGRAAAQQEVAGLLAPAGTIANSSSFITKKVWVCGSMSIERKMTEQYKTLISQKVN